MNRADDTPEIGPDYARNRTIRTVGGVVLGLIAGVYAFKSGEAVAWVVALVSVGVVEPTMVVGWLKK